MRSTIKIVKRGQRNEAKKEEPEIKQTPQQSAREMGPQTGASLVCPNSAWFLLEVGCADGLNLVAMAAHVPGLEAVGFMISLETRATLVTERADVVFPVTLMHERAGTFVDWEGRDRPFGVVIERLSSLSDLRVLAALADGLGADLGFRTSGEARAELDELGVWEGERGEAPDYEAGQATESEGNTAVLATWRMALDESRALDGEPYLQATAHAAEARMSPSTAAAAGIAGAAVISNDRGSIRLPAVVDPEMVDGVVWLPSRAPGIGIPQHLAASAGDLVTIGAATELAIEEDTVADDTAADDTGASQ